MGQDVGALAGWFAAWSWLALRLLALLQAQAIWREATGGAWPWLAAGLAAVLAAAWCPAAAGPVTWGAWLVGAGFEVLLGAVLGRVVGLPGEALVGAARQSGATLGLARPRAWTLLHAALTGSLALALALHRPLLAGLRAASTRWPVGDPGRWEAPLDAAACVELAQAATVLALGLATPVLLTTLLAELVLAACSRGPWPTALFGAVRPWLVPSLALTALGAAWASYPESWLRALPSG